MHKITPQPVGLQHKSCVKSRRRRRVTRPFTPLPIDGYLDTIPRRFQPFFLLLWRWNKGGSVTECYRVFAAKMKVDITTVQRYAYGLEALGHLKIDRVKIGPCRNGANTFHFPRLEGFIVEEEECRIAVEVLNPQSVSTTTEAQRASAPPVSYARLRWEHNRAKNHPPAMRKLHEQNAALIGENRTLRHRSRFAGHREELETPEAQQARLERRQRWEESSRECEETQSLRQEVSLQKMLAAGWKMNEKGGWICPATSVTA
jgi:hypothetical protein